jgi:cell division septal protein FtsQ
MKSGAPRARMRALGRMAALCAAALLVAAVLPRYRRWISADASFRIRRLRVEGRVLVGEAEMLRTCGLREGMRVRDADLRAAERRLAANAFVDRVSVFRGRPDAVTVRIREKVPVALYQTQGHFYTLDRAGTLLPAVPGPCYALPIVSCPAEGRLEYGKPAPGRAVREGLAFLLFLGEERPGLRARISEIRPASRDGLVVTTARGGVPVRLGRGGMEWKIRYLEAVLREIDDNPSFLQAAYIDLRFEGQVFVGTGA